MSSVIGAVEFVDRKGRTRVIKIRQLVVSVRMAIMYLGEVYRYQQAQKAHEARRNG
jgi:hypothetical protein